MAHEVLQHDPGDRADRSLNLILRSNSCPLSSVSNTFTEPELSLFSRILLLFKFIFLPLAHICHFSTSRWCVRECVLNPWSPDTAASCKLSPAGVCLSTQMLLRTYRLWQLVCLQVQLAHMCWYVISNRGAQLCFRALQSLAGGAAVHQHNCPLRRLCLQSPLPECVQAGNVPPA